MGESLFVHQQRSMLLEYQGISLLISQEVSGFVLKEFLEIEALNEAITEASLLGRKEVACL